VLLAAAGKLHKDIAAELRTGMKTVCLWRRRFAERGLAGIEKDAPRGSRPRETTAALVAAIVRKTTTETPSVATHWSTRTLAAELGTSPSMVQRVWKASGLQPHRARTFTLSNDPHSPRNWSMSWACTSRGIAIRSGSSSSSTSTRRPTRMLNFIWWLTTTRHTSTPRRGAGWSVIPGSTCISSRRAARGSTSSRGGSAS
jgi:transposase